MKTLLSLISLCLITHQVSSQMVDDNAFIKTNLVEVAINENGAYITDTVPEGYILLDNPNPAYGIIADYDMNGWDMGSPAYSGDFVAPGTPVEQWGLSWNGDNLYNGASGFADMPGSIFSYSANDDSITVEWIADTTDVIIKQTTTAYANKLFFLTKLKLINTTPDTLENIYYVRLIDPDNEQMWTGDYATENGVDIDSNYSYAKSFTYGLFLGMVAGDPLGRGSYGNFQLTDSDLDDPFWGTGGFSIVGSEGGDISMQMSFYRPELAPGDSVEFIFAYVFAPEAMEEAYLATLNNDYIVECLPDTTISATAITTTTAKISWIAELAHVYKIIYTNLVSGETDTADALVSPLILHELEPCTAYEAYMVTECNDELTPSNVVTFTTDCVIPIKELSNHASGFEIYPNPANAIINLTWNNNLNSDFTFIVFDIMGKQLLSKTVKSNSPDNILSIPVDQLPAGVYQIAIYSGNAIKSLKFIKS